MRKAPYPQRTEYNPHHVVAYDIETIVENEPADGSFPPWPRHKPVAASFLSACWTPAGFRFAIDALVCQPGEEADFYEQVDRLLPVDATGITYNGRGFDNRVLALGAMRHLPGASLQGLSRQVRAGRYDGAHCDLADAFAGMGATRPVAMAEICAALGIPAKLDTDGSQVGTLWRAGQRRKVLEYVMQDCVCTLLAWYHYIAFEKSDDRLWYLPMADLAAWIEADPDLAHLLPFVDCRPVKLARQWAPALRASAALEDAELRLNQQRDEAAFASSDTDPF
ncbi:hypothetical protein ABIC65_001476 [Sphingomonas trueperi]|uniref:hypothetical protein n=1 Tax=Sphingomonas trueperi TaxID=53317 RepID=UPI003393327D